MASPPTSLASLAHHLARAPGSLVFGGKEACLTMSDGSTQVKTGLRSHVGFRQTAGATEKPFQVNWLTSTARGPSVEQAMAFLSTVRNYEPAGLSADSVRTASEHFSKGDWKCWREGEDAYMGSFLSALCNTGQAESTTIRRSTDLFLGDGGMHYKEVEFRPALRMSEEDEGLVLIAKFGKERGSKDLSTEEKRAAVSAIERLFEDVQPKIAPFSAEANGNEGTSTSEGDRLRVAQTRYLRGVDTMLRTELEKFEKLEKLDPSASTNASTFTAGQFSLSGSSARFRSDCQYKKGGAGKSKVE